VRRAKVAAPELVGKGAPRMTLVMIMLSRMAVAAATGAKSIEESAKTVVGTKAERLGIESDSIQIITGHIEAAEHRSAAE
jgi:hypothetical protein